LKEYGDFGIGTVADLDREMLELDAGFYQEKQTESLILCPGVLGHLSLW